MSKTMVLLLGVLITGFFLLRTNGGFDGNSENRAFTSGSGFGTDQPGQQGFGSVDINSIQDYSGGVRA